MSKSTKFIILITLFISSAFICISTNPSKTQYTNWVKEEYLTSTSMNSMGLAEVFAHFISPNLIKEYTSSKNYVLFTIYDTKFNDKSFKILGILNHFIPISDTYLSSLLSI